MKINISNDKYKQLARNLKLGYSFTIFPRQLGKKSAEFEIIGDNETQVVFPVEAGTDICPC